MEKKEIVSIPIKQLKSNTFAEGFWKQDEATREGEDQCLLADIRRRGVRNPLKVVATDEGTYEVIDGCSRLRVSEEAGLTELPCEVLSPLTPKEIELEIFSLNVSRRSLNASQRALFYIHVFEDRVLASAEYFDDPKNRGALGGRDTKRANKLRAPCPYLSQEEMALEAGVDEKDFRGALSLYRCNKDRLKPVKGKGMKELEKAEKEEDVQRIKGLYEAARQGKVQVRKWVAGENGRVATKGKERAPVQYARLVLRALITLKNVFTEETAWFDIPAEKKKDLKELWIELSDICPPELAHAWKTAEEQRHPRKTK